MKNLKITEGTNLWDIVKINPFIFEDITHLQAYHHSLFARGIIRNDNKSKFLKIKVDDTMNDNVKNAIKNSCATNSNILTQFFPNLQDLLLYDEIGIVTNSDNVKLEIPHCLKNLQIPPNLAHMVEFEKNKKIQIKRLWIYECTLLQHLIVSLKLIRQILPQEFVRIHLNEKDMTNWFEKQIRIKDVSCMTNIKKHNINIYVSKDMDGNRLSDIDFKKVRKYLHGYDIKHWDL